MRFPQLADNDQMLTAPADGTLDWGFHSFPISTTPMSPRIRSITTTGSRPAAWWSSRSTGNGQRGQQEGLQRPRFPPCRLDGDRPQGDGRHRRLRLSDDQRIPLRSWRAYKAWSDPSVIEAFGEFGNHDIEAAKALLDEAGYSTRTATAARQSRRQQDIVLHHRAQRLDRLDRYRATRHRRHAGDRRQRQDRHAGRGRLDGNLIDGKFDVAINCLPAAASPYFPISVHSTRPTRARRVLPRNAGSIRNSRNC